MRRSSCELLVNLPINLPDGRGLVYNLLIRGAGRILEAGEVQGTAQRLPSFCPERHIIGNGRFCMNWEGDQQLYVVNEQSAGRWLQVLLKFLVDQSRAVYLRRWPSGEAWAHGGRAANAQRRAERVAKELGALYEEGISERRLTVERAETGDTLRVIKDRELFFATWRVVRRRGSRHSRRILVRSCESTSKGRQLTKKPSRAAKLRELAEALWDWRQGEAAFWRSCTDEACCRTMDDCGLKEACGAAEGTLIELAAAPMAAV